MDVATATSGPVSLAKKRVAVLGVGKMGGIILRALLEQGLLAPERTCATVHQADLANARARNPKISIGTDNRQAVSGANVVLICVKPQQIKQVLEDLREVATPEQVFISIVASVPTNYIEEALGGKIPVVRVMPNTPCIVRQGMLALCKGQHATEAQVEMARGLFDTVGRTVVVEEKYMDAITGLSASGPAYIYIILESLAEAGVKVGLPRDLAMLLAAQTTRGAASVVLETGSHPAMLKDEVTTPAGCTIDGVMELEEGKLRVTLIKAVVKATQRARELLFSH